MKSSKKSPIKVRTVVLGHVGVDSGTIVIADPCYLSGWAANPKPKGNDHGHDIYADAQTGWTWQFTYGEAPTHPGVTSFPGTYDTVVPGLGLAPNDLIKSGRWIKTDLDPTPHILHTELSARSAFKVTSCKNRGGNFGSFEGEALAFSSGCGDGHYEVEADVADLPGWGERVVEVRVKLVDLKEFT